MSKQAHDFSALSDTDLQELHSRTAATSSDEGLLQAIENEQDARARRARRQSSAASYEESESERRRRQRAHETNARRVTLAEQALAAVYTAIRTEAESAKAFFIAKQARTDAQKAAVDALTAALQKSPEGDLYFIGMDDTLLRLMTHHGLRAGLREREEPCLVAAGEQILGNLVGQLRLHARKHGIELAKGSE